MNRRTVPQYFPSRQIIRHEAFTRRLAQINVNDFEGEPGSAMPPDGRILHRPAKRVRRDMARKAAKAEWRRMVRARMREKAAAS